MQLPGQVQPEDFLGSLKIDAVNKIAGRELAEARRRLVAAMSLRPINWARVTEILELMRDTYAKVILAGKLAGYVSPWFPEVQDMPTGEADERAEPVPKSLSLADDLDRWRRGDTVPSAVTMVHNEPPTYQLALGDLIGWDFLQKASEWLAQRISNMPDRLAGLVDKSQLEAAAFGEQVDGAMMTRINNALEESIFSGEGRDAWRERLGGIIEARAGFDEAIQRTAHHQSFRAGQQAILNDPVIVDLFPYRRYYCTLDGRERPTHRVMHERVYHKDSSLASTANDLLAEWNCRCSEVPMTADDALAIGVSAGGEPRSGSAAAQADVGPVETPS